MKFSTLASSALVTVVVASPLTKRDGDCSNEPIGSGQAIPGSADDWIASPYWSGNASSVSAPDGYVEVFTDLSAAIETSSYIDYTLLAAYDPLLCARYCNQLADCTAFNLYFERAPTVSPNANSCPDPTSQTNVKCVRWGVNVTDSMAINSGEWRDSFHVVVAGSNGYNKFAPPPSYDRYTGPQELGGAIFAPNDPVTNQDTYLRGASYVLGTDVADYDPEVCLDLCDQISAYNLAHPPSSSPPKLCNQVTAYITSGAGSQTKMECGFYSEAWAPQYATNVGQWTQAGDFLAVTRAYSYTNATYATAWGPICAVGGCPSLSYQGGSCGGYGGSC